MNVAPIQRSVFISYARADAGDLAERLRRDLEEHGVRAWLDTVRMRGGVSWTEEVERVIDECDSVLALLSRGSFRSSICRAEQLRALRKGKLVVPILAQRDADRPVHFDDLHYRDLSDPAGYEARLQQILADIAAGDVKPLPDEFRVTRITAPPLPPHLVERKDAVLALRQLVTSDDAPRIVGVHGMGGQGKTVLAQALCADDVVQDAFPDGIIWLTIGPGDVDLLEQLREAGTCLSDSTSEYTTTLSAINLLRTQLRGKAILLVLDDVATAAQLEPFRTDEQSAPRTRIVFTTRDRSVGLQCGASMFASPPFEPAQSVRLLDSWAGRADASSNAIAARLGHLPLALRIAGAQMSDGVTGAELLSEYERLTDIKIDRYSDDPEVDLVAVFDSSVARLTPADQPLYYALGLLTRNNRIPRRLVSMLWTSLRPELSDKDCSQIARALERRSLLDLADDRIDLHPLLHDYVAERAQPASTIAQEAGDGLVRATLDADWIVRGLAIEALGRLGGEPAFSSALQAAGADDDTDVRLTALSVLAQLGDRRAILPLIDVLKGNDYETTLAAANALSAIGVDAVMPLVSALPSLDGIGMQDAMMALGSIGDERAIPVLESLEGHPDASSEVHTSDGVVAVNAAVQAQQAIRTKADPHAD